MLCFQCGSAVEADDSTCPNCGAELKSERKIELATSRGLRISQQLKAIRLDQQLFKPGEEIAGRFVLAEMLGKGPLGEVYRATDSLIDSDVAVKVFDKETLRTPIDHERFVSSMKEARKASHENLVRIHDSGVHKDHPWVSMQFLEGLSLRKVLDLRNSKGERFDIDELEPVVSQVSMALQKVAGQHPHGALKPENVILLPDMLKVTDTFAFLSLPREVVAKRLESSKYLAPELLDGDGEVTAAVDVYSLGMIVGEMLFGPDYVPGSQSHGSLSAFDALVKRATAFDPGERYETAEDFSTALMTLVDTKAVTVPSPPPIKVAPPPAPLGDASEVSEVVSESSEFVQVSSDELPAFASSDELPTVEYDREMDQELQDFLPTTEVGREQNKSKKSKKSKKKKQTKKKAAGAAAAAVAATSTAPDAPQSEPSEAEPVATKEPTQPAVPAGRPEERDDDGYPIGTIVAAIVIAALVLAAIAFLNRPSTEVVELGKPQETAKKTSPTDTKPPEEKPKAEVPEAKPSPELGLALSGANDQFENALAVAETESVKLASAATGETPTGENGEPTTPDANSKENGKANAISGAQTEKKTEEPSAATECPKGMGLVKRKWGNYCVDRYEYPGAGARPKTKVSWFNAKKLCESKGKRLCKLKEWRSACGGTYPYGRKFDANKCNTADEDGFERTIAKAGSFKKCRSRSSGAYDMTGNVHEWTQEQKIAGGGFESDESVASCRYSSPKSPGSSAGYIGFRCCADPE